MLTKQDFLDKIGQSIGDYPDIAPLWKVDDPRTKQITDAMATMLSMLSQQIDVAMAEPFVKSRDATVLADAAIRGISNEAKPATVQLTVTNENLVPVQIQAGMALLDSNGNRYVVTEPATIDASTLVSSAYVPGTGTIQAKQYYTETIVETATRSEDFYAVAIPEANDNAYISKLTVFLADSDTPYQYANKLINVFAWGKNIHG
ncbi:hypothetical protein [Methylocucumis oryzae]|uniref:Uncharacterized protein n=1 Tax=Methylocucumis oryzae TaxID=1632867 RepID=A0A0F3IN07_9GAMM|nr:hypothetical protein [Methylocucumis oryzae]KJV08091.1 hypothetical protein VZ94_00600 [Methylocucumis oryzae]